MGEIVQGSCRRQFFADLRDRRIGRVSPRPSDTRQTPIAGIEVGDHLAVIGVFGELESHIPMAFCASHAHIVFGGAGGRKGTTAPTCE